MLDRIKKAIQGPPVTAEWVDMVVTDADRKAERIEETQGPEAANRFREKSGRRVKKMVERGVI